MRRRPWLSYNDLFTFAAMRRDHRWGRETTLACIVALGLACGLAQTAPAQANGAEACPAGLNLYAASATALSACGYRAVPRIALTHMPNGATESVYSTPAGGGRVSFVTPPPSFDAAKASSAELELYGVPAEPAKESPEYPKWKSMIEGGIHIVAPPEQLIEASNAISAPSPPSLVEHSEGFETGSSPVWGGYLNTVPTGGEHAEEDAYTKATGYFQQPEAAGPECGEEPSSATWVGLGGWAANKSLGQAGAVQHWFFNGKLHQNEAFIEVTPGEEDFLKFSATPGYYMEAETQYLGEGKYHFYLYNYANHTAIAPKGAATEGEFDGETADYIVERQYGHNLFNFGKAVFQGYTNGKVFQNYPTERVDMENKKGENVRVSNISKKYEFTATFKNCEKPNSKEEIEIEEEVGKIKRQKLGTGYPAPKVTTGESSEVAGTAAKLNGTVNPEGDYTLYHFEYGTEADNFEGSSQVQVAGEGVKTVPVSATVSGLHPGTTYHDRLVAESGNGIRDGEERTFKTTGAPPPPPPTVTTEGASGIGSQTATLEASINPNGLDTHYYFEYGPNSGLYESDAPALPGNDAGSGSTAVRASVELTELAPDTTYYYRTVASNSTGTSYGAQREFTTTAPWLIQTTLNPHGVLESDQLHGVSCWSSTACTAVGYYVNEAGIAATLVEHWNGTAWEVQTTPNPAGATRVELEAVSCSSSTACIATGYYETSSEIPLTLAERWNGTAWKVETTLNPAGSTGSVLTGVSCSSLTACTAVGRYSSGSGSEEFTAPLAERWNGTAWTIESVPTPAEASKSDRGSLSGVSCSSSTACMAVGNHGNASSGTSTLAERWNGTAWKVETTLNPGSRGDGLYGVSCSSSTACTAVGGQASIWSSNALVERWNGTVWETQVTPNPTGIIRDELGEPGWHLNAVSCPSATTCTAVGLYENISNTRLLLGERWNGTIWEIQAPFNPIGVKFSYLLGVSCTALTLCTGVGYSETYLGNDDIPSITLAERLIIPAAETEPATEVSSSGGKLNGTVNPESKQTSYRFEYGTTASYGTKVPIPNVTAGAGTSNIKVSQTVTGLQSKTLYHFRLVATSSAGTTNGGDQTFTP